MSEDRRDTAGISDAQIDAAAEAWARAENDDLAKAWGQGLLESIEDATQGRVDEDRALLDAIERGRKATESGE
jgi:hypothetical protein